LDNKNRESNKIFVILSVIDAGEKIKNNNSRYVFIITTIIVIYRKVL